MWTLETAAPGQGHCQRRYSPGLTTETQGALMERLLHARHRALQFTSIRSRNPPKNPAYKVLLNFPFTGGEAGAQQENVRSSLLE